MREGKSPGSVYAAYNTERQAVEALQSRLRFANGLHAWPQKGRPAVEAQRSPSAEGSRALQTCAANLCGLLHGEAIPNAKLLKIFSFYFSVGTGLGSAF